VEDRNTISKQIIDQVAAAIGEKWNLLAEKLGYQPDEVKYIILEIMKDFYPYISIRVFIRTSKIFLF